MKPSRFFYLSSGALLALLSVGAFPPPAVLIFLASIAAALTFDWNNA